MPRLIVFLLACFLSFSASAQAKLSFGGVSLKDGKGANVTTARQVMQDNKLKSETADHKVISYVISLLPKDGDLVGPFTVAEGKDLPVEIKNAFAKASSSKIFFDDITVQGADGKKFKNKNYVVACQ